MNETKHLLKSKTFWFNIVIALFTVLAGNAELLRDYLSDGGYLGLMMGIAVGNVLLRAVTKSAVTLRRQP